MPDGSLTLTPHRDVPVIVNSFNRAGSLRRLVTWLTGAGYRRITIVDNASVFPPLLRYLDQLERAGTARVLRLEANHGHTALWDLGLLEDLGIDTEFVYSDPDVVPAPECPADVVRILQELLAAEPAVFKAGLGLRLDDIPRRYRHRKAVLAWETKNWLSPAAPGRFRAPIDTTFALYRPGSGHGVDELAIRTGPPLVVAHESWYSTGWPLTREARAYARAAASTPSSTWARLHLPAWLRRWEDDYDRIYPTVLLVGSLRQELPGYLAVERAQRRTGGALAVPDGTLDGAYLPCGLVALCDRRLTMAELARASKPGALVVLDQPWPPEPDLRGDLGTVAEEIAAAAAAPPGADPSPTASEPVAGSWHLERLQVVHQGATTGSGAPARVVAHLRRAGPGAGTPSPVTERTSSGLDLHARFERVTA